jgi:hypothetical protein
VSERELPDTASDSAVVPDVTAATAALQPVDPDRRWRSQILGLAYPLEFAFIWILAGALVRGISPFAALRTVLFALGCLILVGLLLWLVLRDMHRAGVALLLVLLTALAWPGGPTVVGLVGLAAVIVILLDRLPGRRLTWAQFSRALSTFGTVMIAVVVIQAGFNGQLAVAAADLRQGGPLVADDAPLVSPSLPDIYVIVLDGHPRADTAASLLGLDESGFVSGLKQRGFDVPTANHSNYAETPLTFASMLNMAYLDQIPSIAGIKNGDPMGTGEFRDVINRNAVFALARDHGYQIVATGSGWEQVAIRSADVYLDSGEMNNFEATELRLTVFGSLIEAVDPGFAGDQMRSRVENEFKAVETVARTPSSRPRLVFTHVTAPHPPLIYGADGQAVPLTLADAYSFHFERGADDPVLLAEYRDQTAYIDKRVTQSVDAILASARRPTVVVLLSDHGTRMNHATSPMLSPEAVDNFFAALTPGHGDLFGNNPTPINLFAHLFNAYLGTSLPIRADRSFISPPNEPLQLTEIQPQ